VSEAWRWNIRDAVVEGERIESQWLMQATERKRKEVKRRDVAGGWTLVRQLRRRRTVNEVLNDEARIDAFVAADQMAERRHRCAVLVFKLFYGSPAKESVYRCLAAVLLVNGDSLEDPQLL
jgi:hypothetical protein